MTASKQSMSYLSLSADACIDASAEHSFLSSLSLSSLSAVPAPGFHSSRPGNRLALPHLLLWLALLLLSTPLLAQTLSQGRSLEATPLYMEPSREAPEEQMLTAGTRVQILGYRIDRQLAEWWQVELPESGVTGFVPAAVMETLSNVAAAAPAPSPPSSGSSSLFSQMVGAGNNTAESNHNTNSGQSVFSQLARSGEIEQGRERTQQRALEAELRRQEEALRELERQEQQRLAAEEDRLRREEEALRQQENDWYDDWYDDDWYDEPQSNSLAGSMLERIQQGFQELNELQISMHEETMRNLEITRQNQENQRRQREQQQQWQWEQQQQQQRQQDQQRQQLEQQRQQLAQQRQQREQELARQRQAIETQRNQISQQQGPVVAGAAPMSGPAAGGITFGGGNQQSQQNRPFTGNPGRSAPDCIRLGHEDVSFRDDAYHVIFNNTCDMPVFVIWCGNAPYSLNCGENVANYYASSANLRPGQQHRALIHDRIFWGACEGTIGFGHVDFYSDHDNGDYTCLPTGDYARAGANPQRVRPSSHQQTR